MARNSLPGLADFDTMPNDARVALPIVCGLYAISAATTWRRVKEGLIPAPHREGGSTRWVVGALRKALAK